MFFDRADNDLVVDTDSMAAAGWLPGTTPSLSVRQGARWSITSATLPLAYPSARDEGTGSP